MTNVCFAGVTGWTAPPIIRAIDESGRSHVDCGRVAVSRWPPRVRGHGFQHRGVYASVEMALEGAEIDVLVDYTRATAVRGNVCTAVEAGVHVVIGSSGLVADDYAELDRLARDNGVGVIAAGNFWVMAAILQRAAAMAAQHVPQWEIIDHAADDKTDVPSGTSRELAERLAHLRAPEVRVPTADLHGPVEARGTDVSGTRIHSLRLPSFVVTTEVVFAGPGERLVMRHDPGLTAEPYVGGTLLPFVGSATRWASVAGWTRFCSEIRHVRARQKSLGRRRQRTSSCGKVARGGERTFFLLPMLGSRVPTGAML